LEPFLEAQQQDIKLYQDYVQKLQNLKKEATNPDQQKQDISRLVLQYLKEVYSPEFVVCETEDRELCFSQRETPTTINPVS